MAPQQSSTHPYADIMDKERPTLPKHPTMPRETRAKQFMPFASLRGFDRLIAGQVKNHVSDTLHYEEETWDSVIPEDWG